jgi:competence protein ComEC
MVWSDAKVGVLAIATVLGVWTGWSHWLAVGAVVLVAIGGRVSLAGWFGLMLVAGAVAGEWAWAHAEPRAVGSYSGWATLMTDPAPVGAGVGVVVEIGGERFQVYAYGSPRRRLERRQAGELVEVEGVRVALDPDDRRSRARHVVGRLELDRVGAWQMGSPLSRASNRLRERLRISAEAAMSDDDAPLFTGLVVGDDVRQSSEIIGRFRAVGLSHLTAVSGQNVSYVLTVAGVLLKRLRPWWRLGATWGLIAWFVMLTRVEPSVVRAGTMAGVGALAFAMGRDRSVPRILAIAVIVLVLVDPLLVWSVGFWLSCGATAGVSVLGPWLAERWRGPVWLAVPVGTTVGAQLGVIVPTLLVFGRLPALGIVVNVLAVPVAGFVMLAGIPSALAASVLPTWCGNLVMVPATLGTRWVATVAALAERLAPTGPAVAAVWLVQFAAAAWWWRPVRIAA